MKPEGDAPRVTPSSRATVARTIQEMVSRIVAQFQPEKVVLFGSHARGTAGPDSDVDLLVVMPVTGSRSEAIIEIRTALHGMGVGKDVVVVTPDEFEHDLPGTIVRHAHREGVLLYERAG